MNEGMLLKGAMIMWLTESDYFLLVHKFMKIVDILTIFTNFAVLEYGAPGCEIRVHGMYIGLCRVPWGSVMGQS